jgi:hypothetical protein
MKKASVSIVNQMELTVSPSPLFHPGHLKAAFILTGSAPQKL